MLISFFFADDTTMDILYNLFSFSSFDDNEAFDNESTVGSEYVDDESVDDSPLLDEEEETIFRCLLETPFGRVFGCTPDQSLEQKHATILSALLPAEEAAFSMIMGYIQSGKTEILFASTLFLARLLNQNVIVILRDYTGDAEQFLFNLKTRFLEGIRGDMITAGHDIGSVTDVLRVLFAGDIVHHKDESVSDPTHIADALHGGEGVVVVALANDTQILAVNKLLDDVHSPPFVFIDECDDLMTSTGARGDQIKRLTERARHVIGVSATVFDCLHDDRLASSRVYLLPPPTDYKGIDRFVMNTIDEIPAGDSTSRLDRDPDLVRLLDSNRTTVMSSGGKPYPMITLIKNERLTADQMGLLRDIRKAYKDDYTVIVYNGKNISLYAPGLPTDGEIRLPSSHRKAKKEEPLLLFRRACVQDVLQLLKNRGGAKRFPRIVIISCEIIGRGINIVSRDFVWHLTHMFYRPSKSATVPMMMQSMRLAGRYQDNMPLSLYATEKVLTDILTGLRLQQEIVGRVVSKADPSVTVVSMLSGESVNPHKMPKRSVFLAKTRTKTKFLPKMDEIMDNGWSMEEFMRPMAMIKMPPPLKLVDKQELVDGVDITKLFKWKQESSETLVWKMICYLSEQSTAIDIMTFKDGVHYNGSDKMFQSNVDNGKSKKARNGKLWSCKNNYSSIEINKNIVQYIK